MLIKATSHQPTVALLHRVQREYKIARGRIRVWRGVGMLPFLGTHISVHSGYAKTMRVQGKEEIGKMPQP